MLNIVASKLLVVIRAALSATHLLPGQDTEHLGAPSALSHTTRADPGGAHTDNTAVG